MGCDCVYSTLVNSYKRYGKEYYFMGCDCVYSTLVNSYKRYGKACYLYLQGESARKRVVLIQEQE